MVGVLELYNSTMRKSFELQKFFIMNGQKLFDGWITGPYTEEKYKQFAFLHSIKPIGDYMDFVLDKRKTEEYFNRYGMDYSDIHDPRKVPDFGSMSALYGDALNFVSDNVKRLYR